MYIFSNHSSLFTLTLHNVYIQYITECTGPCMLRPSFVCFTQLFKGTVYQQVQLLPVINNMNWANWKKLLFVTMFSNYFWVVFYVLTSKNFGSNYCATGTLSWRGSLVSSQHGALHQLIIRKGSSVVVFMDDGRCWGGIHSHSLLIHRALSRGSEVKRWLGSG